jgi:hypothetical protein
MAVIIPFPVRANGKDTFEPKALSALMNRLDKDPRHWDIRLDVGGILWLRHRPPGAGATVRVAAARPMRGGIAGIPSVALRDFAWPPGWRQPTVVGVDFEDLLAALPAVRTEACPA